MQCMSVANRTYKCSNERIEKKDVRFERARTVNFFIVIVVAAATAAVVLFV